MKIGIIGGGIAGLGAALSLGECHEVTLYELNFLLGGHTRTVIKKTGDNEDKAINIGFLVFNETNYPNLFALFNSLGITIRPITPGLNMTVNYGEAIWKTGHKTPFWQRVGQEAERFESELPRVLEEPAAFENASISQYLDANDYSRDFKFKVIDPLLSFLYVTRLDLIESPITALATYFVRNEMLSLTKTVRWLTVEHGTLDYIEKLAAACRVNYYRHCPVRSIFRVKNHVEVHDMDGNIDGYDQVILATNAFHALNILADADEDERGMLSQITYQFNRVVLHTDADIMPTDNELWSFYNYTRVLDHNHLGDDYYIHYYLNIVQNHLDQDTFISINPPHELIDPLRIIDVTDWYSLKWNYSQQKCAREFYNIQGQRRIWFCGEHTAPFLGHEGSLVTGLVIGKRLGGMYPFEAFDAASKIFYHVATDHMKMF